MSAIPEETMREWEAATKAAPGAPWSASKEKWVQSQPGSVPEIDGQDWIGEGSFPSLAHIASDPPHGDNGWDVLARDPDLAMRDMTRNERVYAFMFIAASRTAMPVLLARVRELETVVNRTRQMAQPVERDLADPYIEARLGTIIFELDKGEA